MGQYSSLALDQAGNPVISYYDATNGDLRVAVCNDANCAGGNESLTTVATGEGDIGQYSSLALDVFDDTPVIAYYNFDEGDLEVVRCNNLACTGPAVEQPWSTAIAGDVGTNLSMVLDIAGNPVMSYYDGNNMSLNVARCDDPDCATASISPTQTSLSGLIDTSIALDPSSDLSTDVPVVSYIDNSGADGRHADHPLRRRNVHDLGLADTRPRSG